MKITLVNMPWQALYYPSLACGILKSQLNTQRPQHDIREYYGNIRWAEFLMEVTGDEITSGDYTLISESTFFYGVGEWIFSAALRPEYTKEDAALYLQYLQEIRFEEPKIELIKKMYNHAPAFIDQAAKEILASNPDVVGFSTTFMQNVPSLATARRIKQISPNTVILFGGGNCDGEMGAAIHRNFPFVDFVVRGEGEHAIVELVDVLDQNNGYEFIPGLCWRQDEKSVVNFPQNHTLEMAQIPDPDYDEYFSQLEQSTLLGYIEPKLTYESARGCWWGEKHQCLFCGLNGSNINFRSKEPAQLWETILAGVEKYQTLDVIMVDNIIDMKYFQTLLPLIAESELDLSIHYEIKSNLREEQVKLLRDAKVYHVQPGIESLSSNVLSIMSKGVSGVQNVKLLQRCEENDLEVSWNYLYGFPGELQADYEEIIEQIPALYHLYPPVGATRIALERFSPYFERQDLGLERIGPANFYKHVYGLPEEELSGLAFLFESVPGGIQDEVSVRLQIALDRWNEVYQKSTLSYCLNDDGTLTISDRRVDWRQIDRVLEDEVQVQAYLILMDGVNFETLQTRLSKKFPDRLVPADTLSYWLDQWKELGIVFKESDRYLALAIKEDAQRIRLVR